VGIIITAVLVVVALALLVGGRAVLAKGSDAQVANGAVLLTLFTVAGPWAFVMVVSFDIW
jgi:hypothetical protein